MLRLLVLVSYTVAAGLGGVGTAAAQDADTLGPDDARARLVALAQQPEHIAALSKSLDDVRRSDLHYDLVPRDDARTPVARAFVVGDSTDGRAAYWCPADEYRRVARVASDERVARAALRAAEAYERAAPPPSSFMGAGWREGDRITVAYGDGETCTTTVR